jgi:AraC-like DNA-binding protein
MVEADIEELNFSHQHFGCVVATIDKYDEFSKKYEVEHQYYLKMLILNIAEQVINSRYKCIGVNMDNGEIAFLVNVDANQTDELHHGLEECFGKIQHEIAKVFDYTISVGMGNCYQDWGNIHLSYAEAMQALKMKLIKGHGSINVWNNNEYRHGYYYPTILEKYMLNQIETRNISAIVKTVKQLINEIKNKDGLSSDNVIQIFNQLVGNTVVKYLIDNDIDMSHIFGSNFNIYNELSKKETLDEIEQLLMYVYETMIKYLNRISSEDDENVYRIMDYLQKNYNQDIGIQDVADHVGLSYSYVRKIFKEKTGKSIVDFLNDMRINEAKDLLLHNDISIKELAISLGYNSDHTFSRIFKKLEGVTPGEYRNKFKSVLIEERAEA